MRITPAVIGLVLASPALAATLTGTVTTTGLTSPVDLTATGSTNWAVWHYTNGQVSNVTTVAPSHRMAGGPGSATVSGYISDIYKVGGAAGSTVRGGNGQTLDLTYSNAAGGSAIGSIDNVRMVFATTLNTTGQGVGVNVTGDPSQMFRISVWASGLDGQGTLTASAPGLTTLTLLSQSYGSAGGDGVKPPTLFTFLYQAQNASDLLRLEYVLTTNDSAVDTSHVGISAVTVEVVPEPSAIALGALGSLALLRRRR